MKRSSIVLVAVLAIIAVACQPVPVSGDLTVAVSTSDDVIAVGEAASYDVSIQNTGRGVAIAARLTHVLPPSVSFSSATPSAGSCSHLAGTVTCAIGTLSPGAAATVTIVGTAVSAGPASATATVFDDTPAPVEHDSVTNNISILTEHSTSALSDTFTRVDAPTIGKADTGQPWSVLSGSWGVAATAARPTSAGYVLAAADGGSSVGTFEATATEVADEFWTVLRASDAANYWRFGRLAAGAYQLQRIQDNVVTTVGTPLVTVAAAAGDRIRCTLTASSTGCFVNDELVVLTNDPFNHSASLYGMAAFDPATNAAARFDDIRFSHPEPTPLLDLTMVASSESVTVGDAITYTMTVTNDGDGAATAPRLENHVPSHTTVDSIIPSQGSCAAPATTVSCDLGIIAPGDQATVVLTTTSTSAGLATNSASVFHDIPFPELHDSATASVAVLAPPSAELVDTFTRPDSGALGAAETGQAWTPTIGTWAVADETAAPSSVGYTLALVDGGDAAGTFEVSVPTLSSEFWAVLRASNAQNYWRFGRSGDGNYVLQRVQNDTLVGTDATTLATVTPAPGDRVSCDLEPGSLTCSVNGIPVVTTANAFNSGATSHGLAAYGQSAPSSVRFDDLSFTRLPPAPLLVLTTTPSATTAVVGQQVSFALDVANSGEATAGAVRVESTLPSQLSLDSVLTSQGSCSQTASTVTCDLGSMASAGTATVTITTNATGPGVATLDAHVYHDVPPFVLHDHASSTIAIVPEDLGDEVLDTFSRPDQSTLGVADTGHLWIEDSGTWAVDDGHAIHSTTGYGKATFDAGNAFGYFDVVVGEPTEEFWIVFHQSDPLNYWRFGSLGGSDYVLHRIENGQLGTGGFHLTFGTATPSPGDVIRVRLLSDDSIDVFVNGNHIVGTGSFFNIDETKFGIASYRGTTAWPTPRFDLVQFTPFTDEFPEPPHD